MLATNRLRSRWTPWDVLNQMQGDLQREFSDWFTAGRHAPLGVWTREGEALVVMELPGVQAEDIDVSIQCDVVNIEAKAPALEPPDGARIFHRERSRDETRRQVQLPFELDAERVEATYERGLLIVRLFAHASAQPSRIEVKAG